MAAPGTRARRDLPPPVRAALDAAGWTVGSLFEGLSRLRRSRALHPDGSLHEATVTIRSNEAAPAAATLLHTPSEHPALVRFSRGVGLPDALPDVLGLAVRLLDVHGRGRHQDFLLATSANAPVLQHLLVPAPGGFFGQLFSSLLLYRIGPKIRVVGAEPAALESFRLALCVATKRTIARALALLGVSAPESM